MTMVSLIIGGAVSSQARAHLTPSHLHKPTTQHTSSTLSQPIINACCQVLPLVLVVTPQWRSLVQLHAARLGRKNGNVCSLSCSVILTEALRCRFISDQEVTANRVTYPVWVNAENEKLLCNECNTEFGRIHDLKRHYERRHSDPASSARESNVNPIGPVRHRRGAHSRTVSGSTSNRSTPASRILSLSNTPKVSSPLARQTFLPTSDSPINKTFTTLVDDALGRLAITSPSTNEGTSQAGMSVSQQAHQTMQLTSPQDMTFPPALHPMNNQMTLEKRLTPIVCC